MEILKRKVIQLCLHFGNTESLGDRRIDVHRLFRFFLLLLRLHKLQCAHIMKAVGKLDNDDTDILCHGEKHLS